MEVVDGKSDRCTLDKITSASLLCLVRCPSGSFASDWWLGFDRVRFICVIMRYVHQLGFA